MVQLYNTAYDLMLMFGTGNHQFRPKASGICCLAYKNNSLSSLEELVCWLSHLIRGRGAGVEPDGKLILKTIHEAQLIS